MREAIEVLATVETPAENAICRNNRRVAQNDNVR
jgi:hypothetical protein